MTDQNEAVELQGAPKASSNRRVLMGCGIGCGLLIFLFIVLAVATYFLGNRALNTMDTLSRPYLEEEFPLWKEQGILTPENDEVYNALYDAVYDEELGSRWVTLSVLIIMVYHIDDGTISDGEIVQAQSLLDDINEQPGLGFVYWGEFMQSDPGLQEISQKVPMLVQDRAKIRN